jgi:hypothetical protein
MGDFYSTLINSIVKTIIPFEDVNKQSQVFVAFPSTVPRGMQSGQAVLTGQKYEKVSERH